MNYCNLSYNVITPNSINIIFPIFTHTEFLKINGNSPLLVKLNIDAHFFYFSSIIKNYGGGGGLFAQSCPTLTNPWTVVY